MDDAQQTPPVKVRENSTDFRWVLLPILATLGGAWAYKGTGDTLITPSLLTMLALILGGWIPLWDAVIHTNWSFPLEQWKHWSESDPLPSWPYLQNGATGTALHHRLSQARSWWQKVGALHLTAPLRKVLLALTVSLLLGVLAGRNVLLLTLLYFATTQLAALWSAGRQEMGTGWLALTQAGLPWLLGASITQGLQAHVAVTGLVLVILVGLYTLTSPFAITGPILAAVFLIWQEHPVTAGWLLLLALPGFLKLGQRPTPTDYRRAILPWVLGMVGLIARVI